MGQIIKKAGIIVKWDSSTKKTFLLLPLAAAEKRNPFFGSEAAEKRVGVFLLGFAQQKNTLNPFKQEKLLSQKKEAAPNGAASFLNFIFLF